MIKILASDGMEKGAVAALEAKGCQVDQQFYDPEALKEAVKNCKAILDVEINEGQMKEDVLVAVEGTKKVDYFGYCGSQMPTTSEIAAKIHEMMREEK